MKIYIIEHEPNKVLFTSDGTKLKGYIHLKYPQRERTLVSDFFQWCYMEAFLQDENMKVEMDEDCKNIWKSRPNGFDNRKQNSDNSEVIYELFE